MKLPHESTHFPNHNKNRKIVKHDEATTVGVGARFMNGNSEEGEALCVCEWNAGISDELERCLGGSL